VGDHDELLKRFRPALRYDSNEQFFADSAAQYTDAPGTELRRGPPAPGKAGAVIARAQPTGDEPQLSLAFLGPQAYANGAKVEKTDVLSVRGRDYRAQYVRLRTSRPDLRNRMYGRAEEANGRLWLQYWLWYFYNDYQLALGLGTHEGDWELVQLRIHDGAPDVAVYAQHRHGEKRAWPDVEKLASDPDRPVVYVARGSHASYFEPGFHQTEAWYDLADGKRPAPDLALEIVDDATHPWLRWPGRWGDTTARSGLQLDQPSPTGPGTKRHWRNPTLLLDGARAPLRRATTRAPDVQIARGPGNRLQITYDFSTREPAVRALVVTVNSRDEKGVPPMTHTFEQVAAEPRGTLETEIAVDPAHHFDVYSSTVAGDPPVASASSFSELDAVAAEKKAPFGQQLAQMFGALLARIRGDR
jgi:hypothetical protein